jgi:hypothetical protein
MFPWAAAETAMSVVTPVLEARDTEIAALRDQVAKLAEALRGVL